MTDVVEAPKANPYLITYLNATHTLLQEYPTLSQLKSEFGYETDEELKDELRLCSAPLEYRGLPNALDFYFPAPVKISAPKKPKTEEFLYDGEFLLACEMILDTADKRTLAAKLKAIGLSTAKWNRLLKVEKNRAYMKKLLDSKYSDTETALKISLMRNVEAGDLQSMKYFDEREGLYRPQSDTMLNLGVVIGRLMEVLAKHLPPDTLNQVAEEIEISINETRELTA